MLNLQRLFFLTSNAALPLPLLFVGERLPRVLLATPDCGAIFGNVLENALFLLRWNVALSFSGDCPRRNSPFVYEGTAGKLLSLVTSPILDVVLRLLMVCCNVVGESGGETDRAPDSDNPRRDCPPFFAATLILCGEMR